MPPSPARASSRYRPATTRPSIGSCGFVTLREVFTNAPLLPDQRARGKCPIMTARKLRFSRGYSVALRKGTASEGHAHDGESHLVACALHAERLLLARGKDRAHLGHGHSDAQARAVNVDERLGTA